MCFNNKGLFLCAGLFVSALGAAHAAPFKVLIINQSGAILSSGPVNWLSKYLTTVVGPEQGWETVAPATAALTQSRFQDDSLGTYQVIVFNQNTSIGNVIVDANQRLAFQKWLRHGGAAVGWNAVMDHADLWPFMTDSVFSGTKYTDHSTWNSTGGRAAKVQWDTLLTNGESTPRSEKPEYAALKAGFPKGQFTYPDEWYSYRINPRLASPSTVWGGYPRVVDILLTIDENTYDVPLAGKMGSDHPVAWAYTFPPDSGGKKGRFIFFGRGHDSGSFAGKGSNSSPYDSCAACGTKNWVLESIRWAAGFTQPGASIHSVIAKDNGVLNAHSLNGILQISITYVAGKADVEVFDLSGHNLGHQSGTGDREYSFPELKRNAIYMVRVRADEKTYVSRVVF